MGNGGESARLIVEEPREGVVIACLNRPEARNPIDVELVADLHALLDQLEQGSDQPRVLIVTGAPPAFSSGGDLKKYRDLYRSRPAFSEFLEELGRLLARFEAAQYATIAMVNGACAAGGLELALGCDAVVAAESAPIGDAHVNFGQLPGGGGSQRLVRAVGLMRARSILLSGRMYSAREALDLGMVSQVVPDEKLREATLELAEELAGVSPLAMRRMKELLAIAVNAPLDRGLEEERETVVEYATTSNDAREGLEAFAERRKPRFEGS
jgi:enoyl-CoA hydratase